MSTTSRHPDYENARELMATMVENSQKPSEGNERFVEAMQDILKKYPVSMKVDTDPAYQNRQLLSVDFGDPDGEQMLVATSHTDVVGVEGQHWSSNPWELTESDDQWFGRGTCDTHGTGVSMILAGIRDDVRQPLLDARKKVTLLFTFDEEATTKEFSMRGARFAAGLLGNDPMISAKNFIAGEPTEIDGIITPMRAHKGRLLAHYKVSAPEAGHVSQATQNALMAGGRIIHKISEFADVMKYGSKDDQEAMIFDPPYTTVQVSAADVKKGDYSTTPDHARFSVDMRTLPFAHRHRVDGIIDLIRSQHLPHEESVSIEIEKQAAGSMTPADARIVQIAEEVTKKKARGFNGGNEGRIFRNEASMQGITIGPGSLAFAHMPDERIKIASIYTGADIYAALFKRSIELSSSDE